MSVSDLRTLIASMDPELAQEEYTFCTTLLSLQQIAHLNPLATFRENEGLTLVVPLNVAKKEGFKQDGSYKLISLKVHSSLAAVGLTATFSTALTAVNISANVIAGYYHDHLMVPSNRAEEAVRVLKDLSQKMKATQDALDEQVHTK